AMPTMASFHLFDVGFVLFLIQRLELVFERRISLIFNRHYDYWIFVFPNVLKVILTHLIFVVLLQTEVSTLFHNLSCGSKFSLKFSLLCIVKLTFCLKFRYLTLLALFSYALHCHIAADHVRSFLTKYQLQQLLLDDRNLWKAGIKGKLLLIYDCGMQAFTAEICSLLLWKIIRKYEIYSSNSSTPDILSPYSVWSVSCSLSSSLLSIPSFSQYSCSFSSTLLHTFSHSFLPISLNLSRHNISTSLILK
ncbi:hypothetical protein L9F63_009188, partial [Diploptera punctata]